MKQPRLCVGTLVLNEDEILLLKAEKWGGRYIPPSGGVEFGESLEDAARREVKEEAGLEVFDLQYLTYFEWINPPEFHEPAHAVGIQFTAKSRSRGITVNHEVYEPLWTPPQRALELNLESGTRRSIECYVEKYC